MTSNLHLSEVEGAVFHGDQVLEELCAVANGSQHDQSEAFAGDQEGIRGIELGNVHGALLGGGKWTSQYCCTNLASYDIVEN